jgi:hypothetical protein
MNQPLGIASRPLRAGTDAAATHGHTHDQGHTPTQVAGRALPRAHCAEPVDLQGRRCQVPQPGGCGRTRLGLDGRSRRGGARAPAAGRRCHAQSRGRTRLPTRAHRTAPQGRHADAAVGRVPRCPRRPADLGLHPVLRPLQGVRQDAQALDAAAATRRREALHRLRWSDPRVG